MDVKIISTADGSHSVLNTIIDETYHSRNGAIVESLHVFIQHGLKHHLQQANGARVRILEIGMGTGLNALLTLQHAIAVGTLIHYTTVEAYPLDEEIIAGLNYPELLGFKDASHHFRNMHTSAWDTNLVLTRAFTLNKVHSRVEDATFDTAAYDVIYFDAFAPSKQPAMWDITVLSKVTNAMAPGGVFVTYSAKGQLKRDLRSLGLEVETLSGPPGKNEMVRATKSR